MNVRAFDDAGIVRWFRAHHRLELLGRQRERLIPEGAETLPRVGLRPIPLRTLLVAHPQIVSAVLRFVHRVISTFLIKRADLKRTAAHTGALTFIQRFRFRSSLTTRRKLHADLLDRPRSRPTNRTVQPRGKRGLIFLSPPRMSGSYEF